MYKRNLKSYLTICLVVGQVFLALGCESKDKKNTSFASRSETSDGFVTVREHANDLASLSQGAAGPLIDDPVSLDNGQSLLADAPLAAYPHYGTGLFDGNDDDDPREPRRVETLLFIDDFASTFDVGVSSEKWNYFSIPSFTGNDGIETIANGSLNVRSAGTNMLNEPEFTLTVPQDTLPGQLSGTLDHIKWLVYTNSTNPTNSVPGFQAIEGKELVCETWIRGQTYNTSLHPFGVAAAANDPRLAAFSLNTIDRETFMIFDFFLTNDKIFAVYGRLPAGRETLGNYAAFTYIKEVGSRTPSQFHHLAIAYDKRTGSVRWLLNDQEVFVITEIGKRIDSSLMTLNHGGDEPAQPLFPKQLNCGLGHFTLLDGFLPTETALVKLSGAFGFYLNPATNLNLTFVDELSLPDRRLFGQGVSTDVKKFQVKYVTFE